MQRIAILLAYLFSCAFCLAQQYPFVHYTPKDGLVNSRVRKAYQDSKGRMYFMTYGGLSVYDGARFRNYTTQNGLLSDLVNDVLEVGEDSLLVAINTCGLNVLVRGEMKTSIMHSSECHVINHLLKTKDGAIFASADDGLFKIDTGGIKKLSTSPATEYLGDFATYKEFIVFTTNDLKHSAGLFLYNTTTNKITDVLPQLTVWSLINDRRGAVWLATPGGVHNLDTAAMSAGKLTLREPYAPLMHEAPLGIGTIGFNSRNEPLIVTGKAIFHYSASKPPLNIASPDPSGAIQFFFIDREDVLWICHDGNGVYKLSNTKLQATDMFSKQNSSIIRIAKPFHSSLVWIAMTKGQWMKQTPLGNKSFTISPAMDASPVQSTKTHIYAAYYNKLYMAPLPRDNETMIRFKKIMTLPDTANFGLEAVVDPSGNIILFETRNIVVLQKDKQIFTSPFVYYDLIQGMYIDKNKMLWVVSRGKGLTVFSIHPETPSQYLRQEMQFEEELDKASPRCMVVDKNEVLWIGTRYNGLMVFELIDGHLKKTQQFQTQNGLTDNFVTSLACDDNNNIIAGTQTGLDRLIRRGDNSYRIENITKSNNIFGYINYVWTEANTAFALINSGTVFRVEPVLLTKDAVEPRLLIEEMKANGKTVSTTSPVHLEYYQRNISFSVAAPTFIDEKQVKYSYRLSGGGHNQWSDTNAIADINLLNLSPGDYTLHVKAFFPSSDYAPKEAAFSFQILPPWWQTVLFRLIAACMAIGLLILIVRLYYRNKLRRQRIILEKQQAVERERTRIATDIHDDLGSGLSRIRYLGEMVKLKSSQQQNILPDIEKISVFSDEMVDKMNEIVWALNEKNDSLEAVIAYIRSFAAEYLTNNGIECRVILPDQIHPYTIKGETRRNIFLSVKESLHNIVKHAGATETHITISVNGQLIISIHDNGKGIDWQNRRPFSNGIQNIRKRMNETGGTVDFKNENGTSVVLAIPL